jgi:hypothetical protein
MPQIPHLCLTEDEEIGVDVTTPHLDRWVSAESAAPRESMGRFIRRLNWGFLTMFPGAGAATCLTVVGSDVRY